MKIVIVGHVDHGKSTLIGRLLLDTNSLPKDKIIRDLAHITDQLKEERERNITIDTTQTFFKTQRRNYVIIDAPGHVEFLKNMITGATLAEAAVLLVDVNEGVMEETRRHAYIINLLGIDKLIVAFNKMDLVNYEKERFDSVKTELLNFFEDLGIKPSFMIPVSAKVGSNIFTKSSRLNWYKGPALLEALDLLKRDTKLEKRPLRLPVQDVYEIDNENIIVGKVLSGVIRENQEVLFIPSRKEARVRFIRAFREHKKLAQEEENIGIVLKKTLDIKRGEVIVQKEIPPEAPTRFKGNIFWMSDKPLRLNKKMTVRCATQETECIAEKIEERINSSTLETIEKNSNELKLNETGIVIFKTENPILVESFSYIRGLGKFVIEYKNNLQGAGIIT